MDSGVATRPIADLGAYRQRLRRFVYQSGSSMEPVFESAKKAPKRVAYAEGEDERVLRAAQVAVDEGIAHPILIGRQDVIAARIEGYGLRLKLGENCECVNILDDPRYAECWQEYFRLTSRLGTTRDEAKYEMRTRSTLVGAILVHRGDTNAMLCGTFGDYVHHLKYVRNVIGLKSGVKTLAAMQMVILPGRQLFICDTHVNLDPTADQIAEITLLAAEEVRRFGVVPSVALLSHSSFGSSEAPSAQKMREALKLIQAQAPGLAVEGEMHGTAALSKTTLDDLMPGSALKREANLLIMPNVDAANISYNLLRAAAGGGVVVGGILLGAAKSVHILTPSSTVRRIVNMTALAVVDAGSRGEEKAAR
jgi:malate dehydrogenase (oxaloacetate-decarboxylating)(NADP+)